MRNIEGSYLDLLARELAELGAPKSHYSLGRQTDERLCVIENDDGWLVYYFERGCQQNLQRFSSFSDLREYLLKELVNQ